MIVVGKILDGMGAVVRDQVHQPELEALGNFRYRKPPLEIRTTYSCEPLELRSSQPAQLPVTVGHDASAVLGLVRHIELSGNQGDAWAVADVADLPDDLALYFSIQGRGRDDSFVLDSLGITTNPATVGLPPLRFLAGEVAGFPETETLRMRRSEPFVAALLERARAAVKQRRRDDPIMVVNQRPASPTDGWALDADGEWVPTGTPAQRGAPRTVQLPDGTRVPMRYGPPGRVLSVR